jgi:hypothetical protein
MGRRFRHTLTGFSAGVGIVTALTAVIAGLITGNPHALSLNIPCGFTAGFAAGALIYVVKGGF